MTEFKHPFPYIVLDSGDTYRVGQIIDQAGTEYFFVEFEIISGKEMPEPPIEMVHVSEMVLDSENGVKAWQFFATEADRQRWLDWVDAPSPAKVVNLVK